MNFDLWLIDDKAIESSPRAALAMNAIYDKRTSIVFKTDEGVKLPAQLLRLEYEDTISDMSSDAGLGSERKLVLFGIRGHSTLPDNDIAEGYRFTYQFHEYTVYSVITTIGEIQAIAEFV